MSRLALRHVQRMSSHPDVLRFAQSVNDLFLETKLTDIARLSGEEEAVFLLDGRDIVSIIVFERHSEVGYYLSVVWTETDYRGQGCYVKLLRWVKRYARKKGARQIDTDVKAFNKPMIALMEQHWTPTYRSWRLPL